MTDGKVVYYKGLATIRSLSDWGFFVSIHNVLFVPSLAVNLFVFNKIARKECDTYSEVVDILLRRWVNLVTGATEFTATICSDDLAYLNWNPAPTVEHAKFTISERRSRLNHLPERPALGLPNRVDGAPSGEFCEICVNIRLTRVLYDVHGPPLRSRHGHLC